MNFKKKSGLAPHTKGVNGQWTGHNDILDGGWALYTKQSSAGAGSLGQVNEPLATTTQSGDTSDVFIDDGAGTSSSESGSNSDLEIDSKLARFNPVYMPISFKKHDKKTCKSRNRDKLRAKTAGSRSECSIDCYGSRSGVNKRITLLPLMRSLRVRAYASSLQGASA